MSDSEPFLQAILEEPDNDEPRSAYADWLQEHGEWDRAAFIQAQFALEDHDLPREKRQEMTTKVRKLLGAHGKEWLGFDPAVDHISERTRNLTRHCCPEIAWDGSFVRAVRMPMALLKKHEEPLSRHPVTSLHVQSFKREDMDPLSACPVLKTTSCLKVDEPVQRDDLRSAACRFIVALIHSEYVKKIRQLDFDGADMNRGVSLYANGWLQMKANPEKFQYLETLKCNRTWLDSEDLAKVPFPNLQRLEIRDLINDDDIGNLLEPLLHAKQKKWPRLAIIDARNNVPRISLTTRTLAKKVDVRLLPGRGPR